MITLPRLAWQELTLDPTAAATRGGDHDDLPLDELIALGGPESVPVTAADVADDDNAVAFVRAREATFDFHVVHLACAFRPLEGEPFVTVTISLDLRRGDGVPTPRPIALSMKPLRLGEPVEVSRSVRLGASLKIVEPSFERSETRTHHETFLEGVGELRFDPQWVLRATQHTEIRGSQRFVLVIQSPKGSAPGGTVELAATVRRKRFGVLSYSAALAGDEPVAFMLV